jgi:hypothetical protein
VTVVYENVIPVVSKLELVTVENVEKWRTEVLLGGSRIFFVYGEDKNETIRAAIGLIHDNYTVVDSYSISTKMEEGE